jgi:hypothetical protein
MRSLPSTHEHKTSKATRRSEDRGPRKPSGAVITGDTACWSDLADAGASRRRCIAQGSSPSFEFDEVHLNFARRCALAASAAEVLQRCGTKIAYLYTRCGRLPRALRDQDAAQALCNRSRLASTGSRTIKIDTLDPLVQPIFHASLAHQRRRLHMLCSLLALVAGGRTRPP